LSMTSCSLRGPLVGILPVVCALGSDRRRLCPRHLVGSAPDVSYPQVCQMTRMHALNFVRSDVWAAVKKLAGLMQLRTGECNGGRNSELRFW
jgi:hypothetical protein